MDIFLVFLKENWLTLFIGTFGIAASFYFYMRSKHVAKPAYQKHALRLLGREENNLPAEVIVLFEDSKVDRLTKTRLILWNSGTRVLDKSELVSSDPLRISFNEGDSILSYKILCRTKKVNKFDISRIDDSRHELLISFDYLDPKDGATIEVLHDSENKYPQIIGSIKGVPRGFVDLGVFYRRRLIGKINFREFISNPIIAITDPSYIIFIIPALIGIISTLIGVISFSYPNVLTIIDLNPEIAKKIDFKFFLTLGLTYPLPFLWIIWKQRRKYPKELDFTE